MQKVTPFKVLPKESWCRLLSVKVGLKADMNKENLYIMTKRKICQETLTILNLYTPKTTASKYWKQKCTEWVIVKSTIMMWDSNSPLPAMINQYKEIDVYKYRCFEQHNLYVILTSNRTLNLTVREYTFYKHTWNI